MNRTATTALGSLAGLAVMTLAGPAGAAPVDPASTGPADAPCGTPAVSAVFDTVIHPAVFETVEHPAEFTTVPAVTHPEWKWAKSEKVLEHRYERTVTEQLVEWKRDAGLVEFEWARQVLESAGTPGREAVAEKGHSETRVVTPAVMVTEYLYVNTRNDNPNARNEYWTDNPNWNAEVNEHSLGWMRTDQTREVEGSPAVTEEVWVIDVEGQDAVEEVPATYTTQTEWSSTRPAGEGWARTGTEKTVVISGVEQQLLAQGVTPDEEGWYQTGRLFDGSTHTENLWASDAPGGDWVPTGQSRVAGTVVETTSGHSATAPAPGWEKVDGSEITIVDEAEKKTKVKDAWAEQVMVKGPWAEQVTVVDEVLAGPECAAEETPEVEDTTIPIVLGEEKVTPKDDDSEDRPTTKAVSTTTPIVRGVEATAAATTNAPVAVPTSVDAGLGTAVATPSQGTDWRQAAGLFAVAAGLALYTVPARRRATSR